jgi:PPOX class probable F420-dependent enzyme
MTSDLRPSTLTPRVRAFLEAPRFASIATIDPDGMPRQSVVWYLLEGDTLVINSKVGRRWPANLQRDPRIAVSVVDEEDGYNWIGLTGAVEVVDDQEQAQADIAAMARRYYPDDPAHAEDLIERSFRPARRISFRIAIRDLHARLEH